MKIEPSPFIGQGPVSVFGFQPILHRLGDGTALVSGVVAPLDHAKGVAGRYAGIFDGDVRVTPQVDPDALSANFGP